MLSIPQITKSAPLIKVRALDKRRHLRCRLLSSLFTSYVPFYTCYCNTLQPPSHHVMRETYGLKNLSYIQCTPCTPFLFLFLAYSYCRATVPRFVNCTPSFFNSTCLLVPRRPLYIPTPPSDLTTR